MSKYLENNICNFRPLKEIDYNIKKNIFFLSLFKMKSGGYKGFYKYINGIKKLNDIAKKNDMEVRVFIDNTIYSDTETMKTLKNLDRVTLILYECSEFLIDKFHVGLFGTLVRFFPLFKFPNNDSKVAFITDADMVDRLVNSQLDILNTIKKEKLIKKISIAYTGNFFHINRNSNKKIVYNGKDYIFPYCVTSAIMGFKKISPKPFVKFMKKLTLYMNDKSRPDKILSNYYISPDKFKIKCENNICFGVDEYFLNRILFKYLLKKGKSFCYHNIFDMASFNFYKHPDSPELRQFGEHNAEYKKVFTEYMTKIGLDKYSYKELDEKLYTEEKNIKATTFMKEYAEKILELMKWAKKNEDTRIFNEYDFYYLNDVDYHKYYKLEYIRFINLDKDDIVLNNINK
jgi:hypothetical protein